MQMAHNAVGLNNVIKLMFTPSSRRLSCLLVDIPMYSSIHDFQLDKKNVFLALLVELQDGRTSKGSSTAGPLD